MSICAVVIAGGSGKRLWPLSRASHPKQFLNLYEEGTLLQQTFKRLENLNIKSSITICNEDHRFFVADQLLDICNFNSIILEPEGKNTAPAIALAAIHVKNDDPLLLVLPADHIIQDKSAFEKCINDSIPLAESGKLVSFGVIPDVPNTEYGYIKKGKKVSLGYCIDKFHEKPSLKMAKSFLSSKEYLWNSGMFLFKASVYLEELNKFRSDILKACESSMSGLPCDTEFIRINEDHFLKCPSDSIDYAVMEKTDRAVVVPIDAKWNDIGSWSALWNVSKKDFNGNSKHGDVLIHNSKNCYIRGGEKLISAIGLEDLVIVDTKDALMVAHKDEVDNTKLVVNQLKNNSRSEWQLHREVIQPWGKYDRIDHDETFQVKRITVKPSERLSLQKHYHRDEHWIVVSGTAKVTKDKKTFLLSENESIFIPAGVIHPLENPEKIDLKVIEVQSGNYLGEDDIVRYEDKYDRIKQ